MSGLQVIAAERRRQRKSEGYTPRHDASHANEELARAAVCYALPPSFRERWSGLRWLIWPGNNWPWKPSPDDRIRELAKAGALIAAEIDRLQREQP